MSNEESAGVRTRKRGAPMAHILQLFLGEIILFAMDIAVNQEVSMNLYRLHDDFWLCRESDRFATAWTTMQGFAKLMGLEFNLKKTGSVYFRHDGRRRSDIVKTLPEGNVRVGLLKLDSDSCE